LASAGLRLYTFLPSQSLFCSHLHLDNVFVGSELSHSHLYTVVPDCVLGLSPIFIGGPERMLNLSHDWIVVLHRRRKLSQLQDLVIPHGLGAGVESALHESSDPEELSAIDSKLAYTLVGLPVTFETCLAAVVSRWWFTIAVETFSTAAATIRSAFATVGAFVVLPDIRSCFGGLMGRARCSCTRVANRR
jgi:hypothetical protein